MNDFHSSFSFRVKRIKSTDTQHEFLVILSDKSRSLSKRGHSIRSGLTGLRSMINIFLSRKYEFSEEELSHAKAMKVFVNSLEDDLDLAMGMYDTTPK